ncbi:transmembrane protein 62-like [Homalodisca vitripennis]|nr:transmembrane protein 62-like [Homalodisca vitripennis]
MMPFSVTKILVVAVIVILSVAIGNISTFIKVHFEPSNYITLKHSKGSSPNLTSNLQMKRISTSYEDLIWFVQISDIHISMFRAMDRISELEEFCNITLDAIKPAVVLASGDLTDAKSVDTLGSQQYEDEWKLYRNALDKCQVAKKTVWLDVRGNHDNFNVRGPTAKENYYRNYSMQGAANPRSYLHTVRTESGKVFSFIALDACLDPGPKRPFNFFGLVNERETEHLKSLVRKAAEAGSAHSVWFGHYPTSCILSADQGVRLLIASDPQVQAYLCGHLHTLGGVTPHMYTLQQAGFLELELADWKDSRVYRVAAIDHGLFSFIDVRHREWPIALVTNPKHALFYVPGREPEHISASSTHVRVLAFSTAEITSVKMKIDEEEWQTCYHIKGPLYVNSWDPKLYLKGLHHIKVEVSDGAGRTSLYEQPFSLDGTRPNYLIFPRILLMMNMTTILQVLFGI